MWKKLSIICTQTRSLRSTKKNSQTKDLEVSHEHFRGHSKMTSPGQGERGLTNWWQRGKGGGVLTDVTIKKKFFILLLSLLRLVLVRKKTPDHDHDDGFTLKCPIFFHHAFQWKNVCHYLSRWHGGEGVSWKSDKIFFYKHRSGLTLG